MICRTDYAESFIKDLRRAATALRELPPIQETSLAGENEGNILEKTARFIRRFVFFRRDETYLLIATWVVATHLVAEFDFSGYLFAHSSEPQSGKSRLLEVLDLLVYNSSEILVSPTEAVLFRTANDHTQLLDEIDAWTNRDELRSVLNAGFRRGGSVPRMKEADADFTVVRFPVFGPRALAGIGNRVLDRTTLDRTFAIELVRQTKGERREQLRVRRIGPEAKSLQTNIQKWVAANKKRIAACYERSNFAYLEEFRDRTIDIAQPLAAVIEIAYADGHGAEQARRDLCSAIAVTRNEQDAPQDQHYILRELARLCDAQGTLIGSPSELAERCTNLDPKPSGGEISTVLRQYGFGSKSVRLEGTPRQRYVIERSELEEILQRYAGKEPAMQQGAKAPQKAEVLFESIL